MSATANVHVGEQWFGLFDTAGPMYEDLPWTNALLQVMSAGARFFTGLSAGYVQVTATPLATIPTNVDVDAWEQVVEVSVRSVTGKLWVSTQDGPVDGLPMLGGHGPGDYRLRAHVRGRDTSFDGQTEPTEQYLLITWPSPQLPQVIMKAVDRAGSGLVAQSSSWAEEPARPWEQEQKERDDQIRRKLAELTEKFVN